MVEVIENSAKKFLISNRASFCRKVTSVIQRKMVLSVSRQRTENDFEAGQKVCGYRLSSKYHIKQLQRRPASLLSTFASQTSTFCIFTVLGVVGEMLKNQFHREDNKNPMPPVSRFSS